MPLHYATCLRRTLVALLCAQIAVGAPGAMPSAWQQRGENGPNFQPPSAADCARPMQTQEIRGTETNQNPITTITGEEMRRLGIVSVADALAELVPKNVSSYTPMVVGDEPGEAAGASSSTDRSAAFIGNTISNLRGLDPAFGSRTLTMIDGRRVVVSGEAPANQRPAGEPVTAGMVDDNADFREYLAFRNRTQVPHRELDVATRYQLQVRDARGVVVPDAEVTVQAPNGVAMWARTDAGGRTWLHPHGFDASSSQMYEVTVRKNGRQGTAFLQRGQKSAVDVVIRNPGTRPARAQLDLVFLIDATGSMDDEILKLKTTLHAIAGEVAALPSHPNMCFGLVAYRDKGDDYVVRRHDFTNDLGAFQGVLDALQAGGGGDYPEAMNEALAETVHHLSWRGTDTTRLVVLLADAPPHLDYNAPQYDDSMVAALGKGIKVLSVGASGLDKQGEYIQRQIAQYTGGRFVFLTYKEAANPASGPGRETVHDVNNYSVQTLDKLIVRLVAEELEKLPRRR